jgi:hypothetical protein
MTPEAVLARFREYMVGPTRFMNLLSCFELGIIDALRENPGMSAAKLGATVGAKPDAVEQLLYLPVKEGFVAYDEASGGYSLDGLAGVPAADLQRALACLDMIKVVMLRQMFYLTDSVRTGTLVGLRELYGTEGNLFGAVAEHQDLRASWGRLAEIETARVYPWFFRNIDIPSGARVLDLLGGNGLGSIMTYQLKASPGLRVTNFDRPEMEAECLRIFKAQGVEEHCSFIGGNVLDTVPSGFDVVLLKHFVDMFDKDDVRRIFENASSAVDAGGQVIVLAPVYPEDIKDPNDYHVDFFPTFLLGCAVGHGGPQKLSTYQGWLEECGLKVTKVIADDPAEVPPDAIITRVILCATKAA